VNLSLKSMIVIIPLISLFAASAGACVGIPDLDFSIIWQSFEGQATLLVAPDGSGPPVTEARTSDGVVVDATLHLTLINNCPDEGPVVGYPSEDMWLQSLGGGLVFCMSGSIPDDQTDLEGHTQWSHPMKGGGWDEGNCRIMAGGMALGSPEGLTLNFNSPDIDGSQVVNLVDVVLFTQDYFSGHTFRSDLVRDGVLNLSDLVILARSAGISCP
jgi:hypothetical protein